MREFDCIRFGSCVTEEEEEENSHLVTVQICQGCIYPDQNFRCSNCSLLVKFMGPKQSRTWNTIMAVFWAKQGFHGSGVSE